MLLWEILGIKKRRIEMKLGRAKIAKSTVYPDLKSIRALKTAPSEDWLDVTDSEARGIREIFEPFEVGETVIIFSEKEFKSWLMKRLTEHEEVLSDLDTITENLEALVYNTGGYK